MAKHRPKKTTTNERPPEPGYVRVGTEDEVREKGLVTLRLLGKPVGVFVLPDGTLTARDVACKHQGADLSAGSLRGTVITCPRHGWDYDLATGVCVGREDTPPLRAYPLSLHRGAVWVGLQPLPDEVEDADAPFW